MVSSSTLTQVKTDHLMIIHKNRHTTDIFKAQTGTKTSELAEQSLSIMDLFPPPI